MKVYRPTAITPELQRELIARLKSGQVGVFPTDTIYGLSADARHHDAVERILELKKRRTPMSVVPHTLTWARQLVDPSYRQLFDETVERYRGRFTMLWPAAPSPKLAHPLVQTDTLVGLRLPHHWITDLASSGALPLVTTSVNRTGQPPMRSLDDLDPEMEDGIDFAVYQGPLSNPPSTLVRCDTAEFSQQSRD